MLSQSYTRKRILHNGELICILCGYCRWANRFLIAFVAFLDPESIGFVTFLCEIRSWFPWVILEYQILHNGGTNLHIMQISQGCISGITRILDIDPSRISKQQNKPLYRRSIQGYIRTKNKIYVVTSLGISEVQFYATLLQLSK